MNTVLKSQAAEVGLETAGLRSLKVSMENAGKAYVKVGVLGSYANRSSTINNATLGAIHEFGSFSSGIPPRSFLRMPIMSKLKGELATQGQDGWQQYLKDFGVVELLRAVGQAAFNVIRDAFNTGGFGLWPKLKPMTVRRKGHARILIDTGQLRDSITFAVVAPGAPKKAI